ncbi:acyl-CoA thioester hydrolase [Catalinimonas alkaloidigena]|uniref:Acyl-CoA thioester hydrolase n=1 Tax=Catalinimonas alkaloidigena TaxID=1075417 RepID=A0A1G9AKC3_9BACT|nr:thioesterase family protein [Catalinimonas alkaloidigena]SDK27738.1 acyl-CoA thioester hydrolase [Catalinimonas alkaloidigena]
MYTHETQIRVRYAETDQMAYVYYGNYAMYYEVARVEALRALGQSYKVMEDEGVMLPVLEYYTKYIRPARYDDLLTIKLSIRTLPGVRITFHYEIFNEEGTLLNLGETTLVFVNKVTQKPCPPPPAMLEALQPFFSNPEKT